MSPTATALTFPAGTVTTFRPNQTVPYGVPWRNASRWEPSFSNAAEESDVDLPLIVAMAIVESDGNQYRTLADTGTRDQTIQVFDAFGGGPSVGIMQVKHQLHQAALPGADAFTPDGNIRLGARLMRNFIAETGSWQKAIELKYHPGVSADGTTPQDYIDAIESLMAELDGTTAPATCVPHAPPPFDGNEHTIGTVVFHPDARTVTCKNPDLNVRQFADTTACTTRAPLAVGETFDVLYWIRGETVLNENRWWVTVDGSRVWTGGTIEKPVPLVGGQTLLESMRNAGMCVTQGPFESHSHGRCDCYDFAVIVGTGIPALAGGRVIGARFIFDESDPDFVYTPGKVTVDTGNLGVHVYAHLSKIEVNVGDVVETGTLLGLSGDRFGPHLHLQLDQGFSPAGLNLTQILALQGFDVDTFSRC